MKKVLLLLFVSLLFIQCGGDDPDMMDPMDDDGTGGGSDDDGTDDGMGTGTFLFGIDVANDFLDSNMRGTVYLSDEAGNIIASETLANGTSIQLTAIFDTNNLYNATILEETVNNGVSQFEMKTFMDVTPETYSLVKTQRLNPNDDKLFLSFTNCGFPLDRIAPSSGVSTGSSSNGGEYEAELSLRSSPGDLIGIFNSPNDTELRYYFGENLSGNSTVSLDYTTLPFVENSVTFNYPASTQLSMSIQGYRDFNAQTVAHDVFSEFFDDGTSQAEVFYPSNVFDYYRTSTFFRIGTQSFNVVEYSEQFNTSIEVPNLDMDIASKSLSAYEMTVSGDYDGYLVPYFFFDSASSSSVLYWVFGEGASSVSFSNSTLFDAIFADNSLFNASGATASTGNIYQISTVSDYKEFIEFYINDTFILPAGSTVSNLTE